MNKTFHYISTKNTSAISVTGSDCALSCAHCNKKYLQSMLSINDSDLLTKLEKQNITSVLISGGSTLKGDVPLELSMDKIHELKNAGLEINAHVGLIPLDKKYDMSQFDRISYDLVGDSDILKSVYHLDLSYTEYIHRFESLIDTVSNPSSTIVPHITIGLSGKNFHEKKAVDFASKYNFDKLIFIVFIPTKFTEMEHIPAPNIDYCVEILKYSMAKNPLSIHFTGCMRPGGKYRQLLDTALFNSGIDGIVNPHISEQLLKTRPIVYHNKCCALISIRL